MYLTVYPHQYGWIGLFSHLFLRYLQEDSVTFKHKCTIYVMTEYVLIGTMLETCFCQIRHEVNFVGIYLFVYVVNKTLTKM